MKDVLSYCRFNKGGMVLDEDGEVFPVIEQERANPDVVDDLPLSDFEKNLDNFLWHL